VKSEIVLRRGYDLNIKGIAEKTLTDSAKATTFAIRPGDFIGLSPIPKLLVEAGQNVKAGDPIFFDKKMPHVMFCAPVSGQIAAINRGDKRAIVEIVLLADKQQQYRTYDLPNLQTVSREELVAFLADSGFWPFIIERPYQVIASTKYAPKNIFISTFDTAPLAPDASFAIKGKEAAFQKGLDVLAKLTTGKVFLGIDARGGQVSKAFTDAKGVETYRVKGKHPAGNVGVQIHHVAPIGTHDHVWTLNAQDVAILGNLFLTGRFEAERLVALTGSEFSRPQYVSTFVGANVSQLVKGNLKNTNARLISGDVLSGKKIAPDGYLAFHDDQLTAIPEGDYYEMFGWLVPQKSRPSVSKTFLSAFMPNKKFEIDTNTHGEKRAFVVTGQYEQLLPMDILPQHLMKAILVNDFEQMEGLGLCELAEEDVALCEFACTSKQPLQKILRQGLDMMREQNA
jgi:Na+-transporting NADH:ubiquinone oxidoreductase subunit A